MLQAVNLNKKFSQNNKNTLENASFSIEEGQIVSIFGKSGEGKSTIGRILSGTIAVDSGEVDFLGQKLLGKEVPYNKPLRRFLQLIPQQPYLSLDPKQTVGNAICEPLLFHKIVETKQEAKEKALELMESVLLPSELFSRLPSEVSGGQAQRIAICRSLTLSPKLLIADESTSMLDTSSQYEIINIFLKLVEKQKLSMLFISHDINLVKMVSDKIYTLDKGILTLEKGELLK